MDKQKTTQFIAIMAACKRALEFVSVGLAVVNVAIIIVSLALPSWLVFGSGDINMGLWRLCVDVVCIPLTKEACKYCFLSPLFCNVSSRWLFTI